VVVTERGTFIAAHAPTVQLSRFVIVYRDAVPGEHVLYDVLEDRYLGVDDAGLSAISRWRDAPPEEAERESAEALGAMGFVVADAAADEERLADAERRAHRGRESTTYVTFLPTLACNLACTYCFQKDVEGERMARETEDASVAFVLRKVDAAGSRRLTVHYIGGEPLTRKDLLLRTAARFGEAMRERGGAFEWEITTNGIGLGAEFARAMLAHGKGSIKVTLDGDRETHDAARIWRSGQGTFDAIYGALAEVARACPELSLRLGGNFRAGQEASYERLLDRLERDGLSGRFDAVRFKPVVEVSSSCGSCAAEPGEADTLVQLGKSVRRRGIARDPRLSGIDAVGACETHWDANWTVDPTGNVYRCIMMAGHPEMAVGTVHDDAARANPLTASRPWASDPKCAACAFVPVCFGGCLGSAYLQTGRSGSVLCRLESFEKSFREEVVARYLAEFHPQSDVTRAA
jgi:uncharacterized protein